MAGRPERAWRAIARWDKILAASPHEPWAPQHKAYRDDLAQQILEALGKTEPPPNPPVTAVETTISPPSGCFAIHLESLRNADNVQPSWHNLRAVYPTLLGTKSLSVQEVDVGDDGTFHRLLATPFATAAEAQNACRQLSELGQYCAVITLK